jgi:hypothetical protein
MAGGRRARPPSSEGDEEPFDDGMGGAGGAADGRHFNHDNPNRAGPSAPMPGAFGADGSNSGRREPVFLGGSGLAGLGRAQGWAPGPPPPRPGAPREDAEPADLPPELQALRQMFTNILGPGAAGMLDMFGGALMGMGGRAGDYVWGQQGLDDVISDLMNQTNGSSAPPPADEETIGKLEKRSRRQPDTFGERSSTLGMPLSPSLTATAQLRRGIASARRAWTSSYPKPALRAARRRRQRLPRRQPTIRQRSCPATRTCSRTSCSSVRSPSLFCSRCKLI